IGPGAQFVSFQGSPTDDLSVTVTAVPNPVEVGSDVVATFVTTNGGVGAANYVAMTASIPGSFAIVSVAPDRGGCTQSLPITCNYGTLPPTATATTTVRLRPSMAGSFTLSTDVSGPNPDADPSNNSSSLSLVVIDPVPGAFGKSSPVSA